MGRHRANGPPPKRNIPVELLDAGDKVVAVAQMVGAGSSSRIALDDRFAFVFTFKGERVVREQAFRNGEEALEAARWVDPPSSGGTMAAPG